MNHLIIFILYATFTYAAVIQLADNPFERT